MTEIIQSLFSKERQKAVIIAGPCSAETEEQVLATAHELSTLHCVDMFRCGVWKPRTRPGNFEGAGVEALQWLKRVKDETRLPVCIEAATPEHVEMCMKSRNSLDILWIGARTTANPFSVQALADALRGTGIPVMIKNPLNPDIALWSGAVERFLKSGIPVAAIVHRGFYPFVKSSFRNIPKWDIAIEIKSQFPDIPLICDPSHIAGKTELIFEISQKALNLNFDGLMIETHIDPRSALSDKEQQLTPAQLKELMARLSFRKTFSDNPQVQNLLEKYREQIDVIDLQMLELLGKRMKIAEEIGRYKSENNITVFQLRRWMEMVRSRLEFGKKNELSEKFVKKVLQLVHRESIRIQNRDF